MDKESSIILPLPNGIILTAEKLESVTVVAGGVSRPGIKIIATYPIGAKEVLCVVDYWSNKLRMFAFDGKQDEPRYRCLDFKPVNIE